MGELSDRLRALADFCEVADHATLIEAATELDRLGELLGPAAYSTDERWAHGLTARAQAESALATALGDWERALAADFAARAKPWPAAWGPKCTAWGPLPYTRPAKEWP